MHITRILVATMAMLVASCGGSPEALPTSYELAPLVKGGSKLHGVHGMRFDQDDNLYAMSVIGQSLFKVDTKTGALETIVGPREGMGDDIAIGPDGTMYWTAIEDGILYAQSPGGPVRKLWENQRGLNAISFTPDGKRLFVSLVFFGDALYEIDPGGANPPRLVIDKPGGLNGFQIGDDGLIYGPLQLRKQIAKINPDSGAITVVSEEMEDPGALKLDFKGSAYVLNNDTELRKLDLASGKSVVFATLPAGADNLALDSRGNIFVSLSENNSIVEVNAETAAIRYVVEPAPLTSATGLTVLTEGGKDTVYLGDLFGGVRRIDGATGAMEKTPVDLFQPAHLSVRGRYLLAVSEVFGAVQRIDLDTFEVVGQWQQLKWPADALEAEDGSVIVAESGTGRLLRLTGPEAADRVVIAENLEEPKGLAWAGDDEVYVSETGGSRVVRIRLEDGEVTPIASVLSQPEGLAVEAGGSLLVVEVGAKQLTRIEPRSGARTVIATGLPIGFSNGPSLYRSVAVSPGAIYFNSDVDNSVYKLIPKQP